MQRAWDYSAEAFSSPFTSDLPKANLIEVPLYNKQRVTLSSTPWVNKEGYISLPPPQFPWAGTSDGSAGNGRDWGFGCIAGASDRLMYY